MDAQATGGLLRHFALIPDPRAANVVHQLTDMLAIAFMAIVCGADGWVDVQTFAAARESWLRTFLPLPGGIPSHDTFGRLFARLDPEAMEQCFASWVATLKGQKVKHVAIDGKSIRRSFEHAWDTSGMAHLVSVYAVDQQLTLGQVNASKGNELEGMRKLIELITLDEAAVVTIDAAGCQRDIADQIIEKKADYVLAVKANQPTLHQKVSRLMDEMVLENDASLSYFESTDGEHDRIDRRRVWTTDQVRHLGNDLLDAWPSVASLAMVESTRDTGGKATTHRRYYISSLDTPDAKKTAELIRGHWSIENNLHWQLDISFGEDQRRIRKNHGPEHFSRLSRMTLNLLKAQTKYKVGIKTRRKAAGWDNAYLIQILTGT